MNLAATLFCAVTTFLSVQAITVSVDRADIRPVTISDQAQSVYINGWRPLTTGYDSIGVNVSPSSNLDRNLAPLHPVLGKLQEHMAVSERQKPLQRRAKPQLIEYNPPSILGSFAVFSHASPKQRLELQPSTEPKTLSTEREYSFLVPPPRDVLRFELEPHKKAPIREEEPYLRSSQFISQAIKPDSRSPTYYIKPASYINPFTQNRPFGYNVQQSLIPPRHPAKQFEPLKSSNEKPYYQSASVDAGFNKENNNNKLNAEQTFERFQPQQMTQQVVNGNFYNQISHPQHYKQSTFERDPSFLVHESHEVSYVTPSSYKFRPATYHFENTAQKPYPASTVPPRLESNKFGQQQQHQKQQQQQQLPNSARPEGFKQFQSSPTDTEKHHPESHHGPNSFYITDFQKTRYTPDINEVLPKVNQPAKFNQVSTTPSPYLQEHPPKVVYVRPELQQHQYQSSIIPLNINQRPSEVEYETPESISLKHFNEQQFLLQQQLIQQDRQRLREQEKRRQQELQRQQQEELNKRQQEIKLLEQKQKEKQHFEQLQTVEPDIIKEIPHKHPYSQPFNIDEHKKIPKEQYKYTHYNQQQYELPQLSSEPPFQPMEVEKTFKEVTVQKFEEVVTPAAGPQSTTQEEFQPVIRPYRPQKPFRDQIRRRKPTTTVTYDHVPTESPVLYGPETQETLTDIPIQTTTVPETTTTIPVTERIIRTRRPGAPLRRRRPSTTTTTQEPAVSSQEYEEELIKYNTPETFHDFEKKKRIRPVPSNHQDGSGERRQLRKRPGQRVKVFKEHADFDTVPERVRTTEQPFREISPTENYPAPFLKELYSSEYIPTSDKTLTVDSPQEVSTENVPLEFYAETTIPSNLEYYEPTHEDHQEQYTQKIEENGPLDHVFTKTELNYYETTLAPLPPVYSSPKAPTTTTTTTTDSPSTPKPIVPSPKATHRMRPVRYGNATRPRFSIKDYKSRMDYKNRLAQSSSTEPSTVTATVKQRGYKNQQAPADPNFKEPSGRYKYMSRSSYRTITTTTPTSQHQSDEIGGTVTTERSSSRFTPKKRINAGHYYRSRVSATTSATAGGKQEQDHSSAHSTARPENVFSSAIRKRPTLKSRLQSSAAERNNKVGAVATITESTEMQSAAETGFFATTTVASSSAVGLTEAVNEIAELEEAAVGQETPRESENQGEKAAEAAIDLSDVTMDDIVEDKDKYSEGETSEADDKMPVRSQGGENEERKQEDSQQQQQVATSVGSSTLDSTTPFDIRQEEELFAKASQSVADLTSSASALYDKPGMFKAVSPAGENRVISAHLKIATDEPTLPIEAFFHEISKKN